MIEIKHLLDKFKTILLSEEGKVGAIREAISEVIHIEISPKDIHIKNNVIYLNIKPIYKSEILLKQEEITLKLKALLGDKAPETIR